MWIANQRIQHSRMMLYHNIRNSDHKKVARKILAEVTKIKHKNTDRARIRSENKDEQIQMEKAGERKK